jgi:hypothetical protein
MNTPGQFAAFVTLCLGVSLFLPLSAVTQPSPHGISLFATGISASRIYLTPQAPNQADRNRTYDFGASAAASIAYRYQLTPSTLFQFRVEYLHVQDETKDAIGTSFLQGHANWSMESSAMFQLPLGGSSFRMCIGGGAGVYLATRQYSVAGVKADAVRVIPAIDIHVLLTAEYFLRHNVSLRADVLFRDPQISAENVFPYPSVVSNGIEYPLNTAPFRSTVNVNGNVYLLGVAWYF